MGTNVRSYDSLTIEILTLLTNPMLRLQSCVVIGSNIGRSSEFLLHRHSGKLAYENKFDLHKKIRIGSWLKCCTKSEITIHKLTAYRLNINCL